MNKDLIISNILMLDYETDVWGEKMVKLDECIDVVDSSINNISCLNCKYWDNRHQIDNNAACLKLLNFRCYNDFGCIKFEAK